MTDQNAGEPVLQCPFCDSTGVVICWVGLSMSDGVSIECEGCGARGPVAHGDDREKNELILDAIASWNTSDETDLRAIAKLIQVE